MASRQTLDDADRRLLAQWAVACAERVVGLFTADAPEVATVREAVARARRYADGESSAAEEIASRMEAVKAAATARDPAGAAAARSVAQASAVAHMGAHALGAAAYAVKAVSLSEATRPEAAREEVAWQLARLSLQQRAALRKLPVLGEDRAGPLGPGLLTRGILGDVIREIQREVGGSPGPDAAGPRGRP